LLVWLMLTAGAPASQNASGSQASANTTITASKMTVRNQENKAIFEGTVKLTKGNLVVHSDVMVVFFKPADQGAGQPQASEATSKDPAPGKGSGPSGSAPGGSAPTGSAPTGSDGSGKPSKNHEVLPIMSNRSVSMIEATGRVLIEKEDGRATCRKAVYHGDEEKIVLTGEP